MSLIDQSEVTGGGLDPYNALFVNMDNMWAERFGNYDCLVTHGISRTQSECPASRQAKVKKWGVVFYSIVKLPTVD